MRQTRAAVASRLERDVQNILNVVYYGVGLLVGLTLHEYAQALVAVRLGDPTPRSAGRLTINPRPHLDPFGSLFLPGILLLPVLFGRLTFLPFAYAKPMPLNPFSSRRPDNHSTVVAVVGPASNVILAFALGGLLRLAGSSGQPALFLFACLRVQVIMAGMNIVPIPPLDGSRIAVRFLSGRAREVYASLDQYGGIFLLAIFFIFSGGIFSFVSTVGDGICRLAAGFPCFSS
jgi:Zn-dependent protease